MTRAVAEKIVKYYVEVMRWGVFPLTRSKIPAIPWKKYQTQTTDIEEALTWIDKLVSEDWGLGAACGYIHRFIVIDDDRPKHGLDPLNINSPIVSQTQNGGLHHYFIDNTGKLGNIQGVTVDGKETFVDVRGSGGQVVLPPFFGYKWLKKPTPQTFSQLRELSEQEIVSFYGDKKSSTPVNMSKLINLEEGQRNAALLQAAESLLNGKPESQWDSLFSAVVAINNGYKPPLPDNEVMTIWKQATNFIRENPKQTRKEINLKSTSGGLRLSTKEGLSVREIREKLDLGLYQFRDRIEYPTGNYCIFANPGAGKSWFCLWIMKQAWFVNHKKSVFFTLEMNYESVTSRMLQAYSGLTQKEYESGASVDVGESIIREMDPILDDLSGDDRSKRSSLLFQKRVDEYYQSGYRVFLLDHVLELDGSVSMNSNVEVSDEWSTVFANVCKKYPDIWLFIFTQPAGAAVRKSVLRQDDLYGSKIYAKRADVIMSLNRRIAKTEDNDEWANVDMDRNVYVWIDKSRISSNQLVGSIIYFAPDGNFYDNEDDYNRKKTKPVAVPGTGILEMSNKQSL